MSTAKEQLLAAGNSISTAVMVLRMELPTMEAFLKECRDMDNFGSIVDPTLFNKSERRAVEAVMKPLFEAALAFIKAHDAQLERSKEALARVNA